MLHAMLADTPLVKTPENPEYLKILLNGKENLEELFAEMNRKKIFGALKSAAGVVKSCLVFGLDEKRSLSR